ncbi:MAG: hypothetical protein AAF843_14305 [Bacteroidota bacterium]
MKKTTQLKSDLRVIAIQAIVFVVLLLFLSSILSSCTDECEVQQQYTYFEPVYTTIEELRSSVDVIAPQEINQAGKIFFQNNTLFINEPNEGIHVIDNSDPANPDPIAFITVPGSFDLAVDGNILFTDSYIDLVAIDISDLSNVNEVGRIENLFDNYNSYGFYTDETQGVVTDWKEATNVEIFASDCSTNIHPWGGIYYERGIAFSNASAASFSATAAVAPTNPGIGGSMARFALSGDFLYTIDMDELQPIDVSTPAQMTTGTRTFIDWGIETIFPRGNVLFIGAQAGMHIIDINDPLNPTEISNYQHVRSCDPVIVDGDLAYVTLRSGTACQGFTNQLEVIDISDLSSPELLHVYAMDNPHGLGKDGDALFICDGDSGLKVYDASDASTIDQKQLAHYGNIQAFDVIPLNDVAMMIGEDGLFQYDYSDLQNIKLLSHIQIQKNDQ